MKKEFTITNENVVKILRDVIKFLSMEESDLGFCEKCKIIPAHAWFLNKKLCQGCIKKLAKYKLKNK